jgi:DNA damage-binding protein 1
MTLDPSSKSLRKICCIHLEHDIACLSFEHVNTDSTLHSFSSEQPLSSLKSEYVAVGLWTENSIRIMSVPHLHNLLHIVLGVDVPQVRDVLLVPLSLPFASAREEHNTSHDEMRAPSNIRHVNLLIGLGNGTLISYTTDFAEPTPVVSNRQEVCLGSRPLSFSCFQNEGALCVFVCGDRPTVIYSRRNNDSLLYSAVNISGEVNSMTPFNSALCPNCLAMSSETGLLIGSVDSLNKIHIQKYPLGESPRHICHHKSSSTLTGLI